MYWIIFCSGHRIGTAEVESALVSHPKCAEAAVVGVEHEVSLSPSLPPSGSSLFSLTNIIYSQVKGQGIYAFVTLVDGVPYSEELRKSLILAVRNQVWQYFSRLFNIFSTYGSCFLMSVIICLFLVLMHLSI